MYILKDHQKEGLKALKGFEKRGKGGFLCDEPGLGKTVTSLSTIESREKKILIVSPSHLLNMWVNEMKSMGFKNTDYIIFHGQKRNMGLAMRKRIVITSYGVLLSEFKKDGLNDIQEKRWDRLIVDEYHNISNERSISSQVVSWLKYKKVILISGTPVKNRSKDVKVGLKMLNKSIPNSNEELFRLFKSVSVCRTKDILLKSKKVISEVRVKSTKYEQDYYRVLLSYFNSELHIVERRSQMLTNTRAERLRLRGRLLTLILRLRQLCSSPLLLNDMISGRNEIDAKTKEYANKKEKEIRDGKTKEECPVCLEEVKRLLDCGHPLCDGCVEAIINEANGRCPMCRKTINDLKEEDKQVENSSKLNYIRDIIVKNRNKSDKIVFVSQWKGVLNRIQEEIQTENEKYIQIDGTMSTQSRVNVCREYNRGETKYCLISMCCSVEGLSLIGSKRMIFMDPWWNHAKMEQVEDRIHRMGQTEDVEIEHLIMEDTIEKKLVELIKKKNMIQDVMVGKKDLTEENGKIISEIIRLL